jgi:gas vesicle protein
VPFDLPGIFLPLIQLKQTLAMSETPKEITPAVSPVTPPNDDSKFDFDDLLNGAKDILGKLKEKGSAAAAEMQEELKELQGKMADETTREAYKAKAMGVFADMKGKFAEFADDADDEIKEKFGDARKMFDDKYAKFQKGELIGELKQELTEAVAEAKEELKEFTEDVGEAFANLKSKFFGGDDKKDDEPTKA